MIQEYIPNVTMLNIGDWELGIEVRHNLYLGIFIVIINVYDCFGFLVAEKTEVFYIEDHSPF